MPDRNHVSENPYVGMVIHFRKDSTSWVLMVNELTDDGKLKYLWEIGLKSLKQAENWTAWRESMWYSPDSWLEFIAGSGHPATEINWLNGYGTGNHNWEV